MEVKIGSGLTFYEEVNPKGKEVWLILHGWGQNGQIWQGVAGNLPHNFRVIMPDLPAFGHSSPLPSPTELEDYVIWVKTFAASLNLKKINLIGHSFGGQIAVTTSVLYPNLVNKLVLVAPAVIRDKESLVGRLNNAIKKMARYKGILPKKWRYRLTSHLDYAQATEAQKEIMKRIISLDLHEWLVKITQETLLVWGENDREIKSTGKQLMRQIPKARLKVVYEAGHNLHLEKPAELAGLVERFAAW